MCHMCQVCDKIPNLKYKIESFVYFKVNGGLILYYFENMDPYEYLLVKQGTTNVPNPFNL